MINDAINNCQLLSQTDISLSTYKGQNPIDASQIENIKIFLTALITFQKQRQKCSKNAYQEWNHSMSAKWSLEKRNHKRKKKKKKMCQNFRMSHGWHVQFTSWLESFSVVWSDNCSPWPKSIRKIDHRPSLLSLV